jgi:alanyl-tRNA synthetase
VLGTSPAGAHDKVTSLLNELDAEHKKLAALEKELSRQNAEDILDQVQMVNGIKVLSARVENVRVDSLREMSDTLRARIGSGIIVLGSVYEGRPAFIAVVTPDLVQKGYNAGEIIKKVAQVTGGGGGGKAGMAQAGGKDNSKIDEALQLVEKIVEEKK